MQVLSPDFSRYLSHCITILPDAQGQNDSHAACAAELPGICNVNLVSDTMAMTYRQVRGRAASLSPKSRPKIPLPAQSALCLPRNLLTTAHTVRKMQKFLNGRCVPYDGQDGAAIGCSVSAAVFSHRSIRHRRTACLALLRTVSDPNSAGLLRSRGGTGAFVRRGTIHARTEMRFQDPGTGWNPPSPWYLDCTGGPLLGTI